MTLKELSLWSEGIVTSAQHSAKNWCRTGCSWEFCDPQRCSTAPLQHNDSLPAYPKLDSKALEYNSHINQGKMSCSPPGSKKKLSHMFYILTSAVRNTKKVELWHPAVQVPDTGWDDQHCLELLFHIHL